MTVQEVAKCVMRVTGMSQTEVAKKAGLTGQSTISMFLQSKHMRVDSLLSILNACGYELIARSVDGEHPEYVIGEDVVRESANQERINEMVKKAVADAMAEYGICATGGADDGKGKSRSPKKSPKIKKAGD